MRETTPKYRQCQKQQRVRPCIRNTSTAIQHLPAMSDVFPHTKSGRGDFPAPWVAGVLTSPCREQWRGWTQAGQPCSVFTAWQQGDVKAWWGMRAGHGTCPCQGGSVLAKGTSQPPGRGKAILRGAGEDSHVAVPRLSTVPGARGPLCAGKAPFFLFLIPVFLFSDMSQCLHPEGSSGSRWQKWPEMAIGKLPQEKPVVPYPWGHAEISFLPHRFTHTVSLALRMSPAHSRPLSKCGSPACTCKGRTLTRRP